MRLEYVEELGPEHLNHFMQIEHYSSPIDRNYAICVSCKKYTTLEFGKAHHRILNFINGVSNIGPSLVAVSSTILAAVILFFHR